ncbi:hypothetical protein PRIPAC_88393 [Pristionchus pacificus]|uniref:Uncharacterized protein n=1 Tax=Pristionchus pacificus TaxID=54126 RepID=A0A2A6CY70_PRIPA|nr:hypothetical protein PRIPAC_88393 [Pristionchus pacificus]|eukprot:PDM82973.1 hypothetical protein PRIPAC_37366 [Pristionchus pacificus]
MEMNNILADTPHKTLEFISVLRIGAYVAGAIFSTTKNKEYKFAGSFTPIFAVEAFHQFIVFTYEFLMIHANNWKLVIITAVYLLYLLLMFRNQCFVPFLSSLVFITLLFFIDAFRKDDTLCATRQYSGYAWNLMMLGSIIELIALAALFSSPFWYHHLEDVEEQFYIAVLVAIVVRIPNFVNHITIQMAFTLPLLLQIFLRALPIAFPAVFYYKLRKDGHEHSADRI